MRSILALPIAVVLLVLLSGPAFYFRPPASVPVDFPIRSPQEIDDYLEGRERTVAGLRPELAKSVQWVNTIDRRPSRFSIVYLHGFSASRRDISPVVEDLARDLKANVYFARLKAHGLENGQAFASVKAMDWYEDAAEALAIGRLIGEKVILIGTSTGATLATILAMDTEVQKSIGGLVLLSPNFGINDFRAKFISGPMGKHLARFLIGVNRISPPENDAHGKFWTSKYHSQGIVALMNLTNYMSGRSLESIKVPTLVIYTDKDTVVDVHATRNLYETVNTKLKKIVNLKEATRHELTGEALAPETVQPVIQAILTFCKEGVN